MMDDDVPPVRDEAWRQEQEARMLGAWDMLSGILQAGMSAPAARAQDHRSVPFVVITGFLGAGKTTLLNALLTQPHGKRLAVLVNDFGAINIDAMLISQQTIDTISLSNGCTCCSLAGDLATRLSELTGADPVPDVIVLEASGLADPHGIVQIALANKALSVEGIVAVVDAQAMQDQSGDTAGKRIFNAQLNASDLIIANKLALVDPPLRAQNLQWLHERANGKPVIERDVGEVPFDLILGIQNAALREPAPWLTTPRLASHGYESVSLTTTGTLDDDRFTRFLESLPGSVVRAKGVVRLASHPQGSSVYQRVGPRWSIFAQAGPDRGSAESSVVFIAARGSLDAQRLQAGLDRCRTTSSPRELA